jgi:Tfp pilus assembly protein PilF
VFQETTVTRYSRRFAFATLFAVFVAGLALSVGQAQTPTPTPAPAQASPRPQPPEIQALNAAVALTDPAAKLAALEKIRTDFPQATNLVAVDNQILSTLVNGFPDRVDAVTEVFDRIIGRIPAEAAPDARLQQLTGPIGVVTGKKLLLDKSETLMTSAIAALDPEKYAQTLRDAAKRTNRQEPQQAQIDSQFGAVRARGLETLARVYTAKGNDAKALETYKEAVKASPAFGTAQLTLVDLYTAKNDYASAEAVIQDSIKAANTPAAATRPKQALADLYIKKGDDAAAEATLKDIVKDNPTLTAAVLPLARLEAKRGDNTTALDHFMTAALSGALKPADDAAMKALWDKVHPGQASALEAAMDDLYRSKFPNPVTPEMYKPTPERTGKLVLLELFTGSGCPPCVASDLALDAVVQRYGNHVTSLVYHEHIPQPDPMVAANNNDRRLYYSVSGVPTFEIDGSMVANAGGSNPGGGGRTNTTSVYNNYTSSIDKMLEQPARAALTVSATGEGDQIAVTVNVLDVPAQANDLRLHIVLAEKELKFTGENGIRFHPMAVRATAGEKGAGLPISAKGQVKYTFSLSQIKDEVTKSLATEMEKRHKGEAPGSTPREYAAEVRGPYTTIDTSELVVVAFIQEGAYRAPKPATPAPAAQPAPAAGAAQGAAAPARPTATANPTYANVLNAAKADVVFAPAAKTKGGGK